MPLGLRVLHELADGLAGVADRLQLTQHGLVRAAMQRPGQRVDAGGDRRIQVRVGGAGDADHRRGAILLMVGMDDEQTAERVHVQRVGIEPLVWRGEAHAQEIVDVAAGEVRVEHRLIAAAPENVADHRARLRHDDLRGLIQLVGVGDVGGVGVERRKRVHRRSEHAHRMGGTGERAHERAEILSHHGLVVDVAAKPVVFRLRRQVAVSQQPRDLKEIGMLAQLLDGVAPVAQDRPIAVYERDLRFALRRGQEAGIKRDPAVVAQLGDHDAIRAGRSLDDRQRVLIRIHMKFSCRHARSLIP